MDYEIEYRRVPHGENSGLLTVYVNKNGVGDYTEELFTFASLADVLGLPASTLEGRYARTGLKALKVDVRNAAGRPIRCFPLPRLDEVILVLTTPGASIVTEQPRVLQHGMLAYEEVRGKRYYTPQNLADTYGVTVTTIRSRLKAGGFLKDMVPIHAGVASGRPRLGFTQEDISAVLKYLDEWAGFRTPVPDKFMQPPASPAQLTPLAAERTAGHDNVVPLPRPWRVNPVNSDEEYKAEVEALAQELGEMSKLDTTYKPIDLQAHIKEQETAPRYCYNNYPLTKAWELFPEHRPEDDDDAKLLLTWERVMLPAVGGYDEAPLDPYDPAFEDKLRVAYTRRVLNHATKRAEEHRRMMRSLLTEQKAAYNMRSAQGYEMAKSIDEKIAALGEPEPVMDAEAFVAQMRDRKDLVRATYETFLAPLATIREKVLVPGTGASATQTYEPLTLDQTVAQMLTPDATQEEISDARYALQGVMHDGRRAFSDRDITLAIEAYTQPTSPLDELETLGGPSLNT